jgi:hypothetical protein
MHRSDLTRAHCRLASFVPVAPALAAAPVVAALLVAAALAGSPALAQYPPADYIIPIAGEGVVLQGEPVTYAGDRLYDYIDGGAPQFIEYGFMDVASQEIRYHERTYIFDVYCMHDPLAAFGVFSVRRPPSGQPLGSFAYGSRTANQALLAYGPYYVEIVAYESVPETAAELDYLAQRGTAAFDRSRAPTNLTETVLFEPLPQDGRVKGSEKIARGPVGLRTALASVPAGAFRRANDAVLNYLFPSPETMDLPRRPLWQIVAYHPQPDSIDGGRPATTLVRLSDVDDVKHLLEIAGEAMRGSGAAGAVAGSNAGAAASAPGADASSLVELPGKTGWVLYDDKAGHCFARLQGEAGLFIGHSRLPRDRFMAWVLTLGNAPQE